VLELSGEKKNFKAGVRFLKDQGVKVTNAGQEVKRTEERCIHCGACTAVCPTGALHIQRPEMAVEFEEAKCSVCELCISACPTRAMKIRPINTMFFE
jgi:ferredoxin